MRDGGGDRAVHAREGDRVPAPETAGGTPERLARPGDSGGFLDPIEGTLLLTAVGIAIAAPLGVGLAVWMSEYQRPAWLARSVESGVEMIAGAPSVLLAMFGLVLFARPALAFLSQTSAGGSVYGTLISDGGRDDVAARAAAGRCLHARGAAAGAGARARGLLRARQDKGDDDPQGAAAVGAPQHRQRRDAWHRAHRRRHRDRRDPAGRVDSGWKSAGGAPLLSTLRGTGGTLTSYVLFNSPAGEGNAHEKAYAAAFVLLLMVLALERDRDAAQLEPRRHRAEPWRFQPLACDDGALPWIR